MAFDSEARPPDATMVARKAHGASRESARTPHELRRFVDFLTKRTVLLRQNELLPGFDPPDFQAIDFEQPGFAHAETPSDLGERITRFHDIELRTAGPLVAHAELVTWMNGSIGVDAVQPHESVEIESIPSGNVREGVAALDDVSNRNFAH